jgi:hypothetical protein
MGTMKDSFKTIALLVCGAVLMAGFSNNAFTVKQAEARSSSVEPVQKWDHRTVTYEYVAARSTNPKGLVELGEPRMIPPKEFWSEMSAVGGKTNSDSTFFKRFGDRGWELVFVLRSPTDNNGPLGTKGYKKQWYFKKPL